MARAVLTTLDLTDNEIVNYRLQMLAADPSPLEAKIYYNTSSHEIRVHNGTGWAALGVAGSGEPPSGAAGGDLTGSYPNPELAPGVVTDAEVGGGIAIGKIAGLDSALSSKADSSEKGQPNGFAALDGAGLIPTAQLPPLAINEIFTVASEAEMLALTAQPGDMAIRTDNGLTYVLATAPSTDAGNWKAVTAAGQVTSVNGQTGTVNLTADDLTDSVGHFAADVDAGNTTVVTHNLGTRDVTVEVYRNSTPYDSVEVDVERTDVNSVTLRFAAAVTAGQFRVVVTGR